MENTTICAISTPIGVGGIAIIRLSGKDSLNISKRVFTSKSFDYNTIEPRKMYLGTFTTHNFTEKCIMVYFKSPYSYTGEDLVEFQCHGGVKLAEGILQELINNGAVLAEGGEFTKRAFINGKLSLDEAEGVIDVINSESDSEIRAGYNLMQGNLHKKIVKIQSELKDCIAKLEVSMDYPEENLEEETKQNVDIELKNIKNELVRLYNTSNTGMSIKNGTKILILGKSNVGKSSLMNALLEYDRAIVTNIKGTTRDILEEIYIYKGAKFVLIDTAGIRESSDIVENIGIEKAKNLINESDIILFVIDGSEQLDSQDYNILKLIRDKNNIILVINKSDNKIVADYNLLDIDKKCIISAKNNENIIKLKDMIYDLIFDKSILSSNILLTNLRHINIVKAAIELTDVAISSIGSNINLDLCSIDIKNIWLKLGEITGETEVEEIIDTIFSKFCVGK